MGQPACTRVRAHSVTLATCWVWMCSGAILVRSMARMSRMVRHGCLSKLNTNPHSNTLRETITMMTRLQSQAACINADIVREYVHKLKPNMNVILNIGILEDPDVQKKNSVSEPESSLYQLKVGDCQTALQHK
ncbi:hypothetical protein Bpfe_023453 [Biomphalaria pfeifferi]|uniref:Uncharacterized protein n=1 Tax=Biomphalaria pfeifferi TaxID=112525 RepID=A0AAD8B2W3_BIOPF|nr:hypothetical protein Bpfe_023453 [Biomphalaria pfeifferi]